MAPRVFIVRHGERVDHVDETWVRRAVRQHDPPLTPRGRQQAQLLGLYLRGKGVTKIFCSPLIRCVQTGDGIASGLGLQGPCLYIEEALQEVDRWIRAHVEGPLPKPWILQKGDLLAFSDRVNQAYDSLRPVTLNEQGYEAGEFWARCHEGVNAVVSHPSHQDPALVLVGHGASTEGALRALGIPVNMGCPHYTGCTEVVLEGGGWRVVGELYSTAHLAGANASSDGKF